MKFTIFSQNLVDGLSIAMRGVPNKATQPVLEAVHITAENGQITITGADGLATFTWRGDAYVEDGGEALLPGKIFTDLIRKMPKGDVQITTDDKAASIRFGKNRSKLALVSGNFPAVTDVDDGYSFPVNQGTFRDMISRAACSLGTDTSRLVLTGGYIQVFPTEVRLTTLDGFRMSVNKAPGTYVMPAGKESVSAVVPGRVLVELSRAMKDPEGDCLVTTNGRRVEFVFSGARITSSLLTGEYVDYEKMLPKEFKTEALILREATEEAIGRADLMAREGKTNLIRLSFSDHTMKVSSMSEIGDTEDEMDVELRGEPMNIAFNSRYLMDIFRNVSDETLCVKMNSSTAPCIVTPKDGDGWLHLLLPVRTF